MRRNILAALLEDWRQLITQWSGSGALSRAAIDALQLQQEPERLRELVPRWSIGDFRDLPPIELLPAAAMPGAAGAYAISTGTIYLNAVWLQSASPQQALAVLTEELGHHLDAQLNHRDTPGDEGELFAALLMREGVISAPERQRLRTQEDHGAVLVADEVLAVEKAAHRGEHAHCHWAERVRQPRRVPEYIRLRGAQSRWLGCHMGILRPWW